MSNSRTFGARLAAWARRAAAGSMSLSIACCAHLDREKDRLMPIPAQRIRVADDIKLADHGWPAAQWWRQYGDPQLDALMVEALKDAPAMAVARARVDASRAQLDLVNASRGAQIDLIASIDRQSVSENGFTAPFAHTDPALGTTGPWYTEGQAGLAAQYKVDLWGKERARVNAALGAHYASKAEAADVELLLASRVVSVYYDIQTLYAVQALLEQARDIEGEAAEAHRTRLEHGLEPRTLLTAALAHKIELERQIESTRTRARVLRESLRALTGAGAKALPAIAPAPLQAGSGTLPARLEYELLARRPDLQAMRWYVQASIDNTEAAKAAFYPSFDIKAFIGFDALHLGDLLQRSSRQINLVPGLTLPIFDSGRLNANLASSRAQSRVLVAQYNESVLSAVREVAQASLQMDSAVQQASMQEEKLKATRFSFDSTQAHYRRGLTDSVTAMEAQLPVLQEEGKAAELRGATIHAEVALATALGGGYRTEHEAGIATGER